MKKFFALLAVVCLFTGCGGGSGGSTISGKVTLADGSPAPRGSVMIRNDAGTFQGSIGSDGTYTIEGVADGEYSVAVVGVTDKEGPSGMEYNEQGEAVAPAGDPPKSLIDAKYSYPDKSGLSLTVPGNYDLKLDAADAGS